MKEWPIAVGVIALVAWVQLSSAYAIHNERSRTAALEVLLQESMGLNEQAVANLRGATELTERAVAELIELRQLYKTAKLAQRMVGISGRRCRMTFEHAYNLAQLFVATGQRYDISPTLLAAVAHHESCFNTKAQGTAKEIGLMQILPSTGRALGYSQHALWNPQKNVEAAARLLADRPVGERTHITLLVYNQGHSAATGNNYGHMVAATYRRYNASF